MERRVISRRDLLVGTASLALLAACGGKKVNIENSKVSPSPENTPTSTTSLSTQTPEATSVPTTSAEQLTKEAINKGKIVLEHSSDWEKYFIEIDEKTAQEKILSSREEGVEKYLLPFDPRGSLADIEGRGWFTKEGKLFSAVFALDGISKNITVIAPTNGMARMSEIRIKKEDGSVSPNSKKISIATQGVEDRGVEVNINFPLDASVNRSYFPDDISTPVEVMTGSSLANVAVGKTFEIEGVKNNLLMQINPNPFPRPPEIGELNVSDSLDFLLAHEGRIAFVTEVTSDLK